MPARDIAALYVRWTFARAIFSRGYWLVANLYLVVVAGLTPFELIAVGVAQGLVGLASEIPTGVVADTMSRKWSVVIAHVVMGSGMLLTGLVTSFPALVGTQMLWGLGWSFTSGADVAWLTDELDQPERTARVLTASARFGQFGAAVGLLGLGGLAWATDLGTAIVTSGGFMILLGVVVALVFPERNFQPAPDARIRRSLVIFRDGLRLARHDRTILFVLAVTLLVNAASEGYERLFNKHIVDLGFPAEPHPIVWFTAFGIVALATGALALRIVEARIDGRDAAPRLYASAALCGTVGMILLALAPDPVTGLAGALLVGGIAFPVTRCVSVVWVNRRTTSDVRATVQSLLGQSEYAGEIIVGFGLAALARATSIPVTMIASAALLALAAALTIGMRSRRDRDE